MYHRHVGRLVAFTAVNVSSSETRTLLVCYYRPAGYGQKGYQYATYLRGRCVGTTCRLVYHHMDVAVQGEERLDVLGVLALAKRGPGLHFGILSVVCRAGPFSARESVYWMNVYFVHGITFKLLEAVYLASASGVFFV